MAAAGEVITPQFGGQKWEYLRVVLESSAMGDVYAPSRVYVDEPSGKVTEWTKQAGEKTHASVVRRLLNQLGKNGWDLVGVSDHAAWGVVLYFKRPESPP